MERLTYKSIIGGWTYCVPRQEAVDRLAAYEDTGLEPGDIDALQKREQGLAELLLNISCGCAVPYSRLAKLAQAEKDGRLMELPPNDPLTLEELREMDGEPVWIERVGDTSHIYSSWAFVNKEHCLCRTSDGSPAFFEVYGKAWLAYRRKPDEVTL